MMTRGRLIFTFSSLATVLLVAAGTLMAANNRQNDDGSDSLYKYLTVFTEVFSLVDRAYVDEQDPKMLVDGALEGTLDALDPFSMFIPAGRLPVWQQVQDVGMSHSGMLVLKERGVVYVVAVEPGSPAEEAGFESQMILSEVAGERTRLMNLLDIQAAFAGAAGSTIELERIEQGEKKKIEFTLAEYPTPPVELRVEKGLPVLRIPAFRGQVAEDVKASLQTLQAEDSLALPGIEDRSRLLLDLRGVVGGDPQVAFDVAKLFTEGDLGSLRGRDGELETFQTDGAPLWSGQKLGILMSRNTQGPSEVLATVLAQSAEAFLLGESSFGHAGRGGIVELSNGARLAITQAFYTGPDSEPLNKGLEPDERLRPDLDDEDSGRDSVLEKALDWMGDDQDDEEEELAEAA